MPCYERYGPKYKGTKEGFPDVKGIYRTLGGELMIVERGGKDSLLSSLLVSLEGGTDVWLAYRPCVVRDVPVRNNGDEEHGHEVEAAQESESLTEEE